MDAASIAPALTATTALVAVFLTPFVALRVAKRQIETSLAVATKQSETTVSAAQLQFRANVLSKNRQDWINSLRDELSHFVSLALHANDTMAFFASASTRAGESHTGSTITEIYRRVAKIKLLANPKEADHVALIQKLGECLSALKAGQGAVDLTEEVVSLSQAILKREWEQVKQGA